MGVRIAVLGLGEAGAEIAADLARAGADVHAWDPRPGAAADGVARAADAPDAVAGSPLVLSVNGASAASAAAREALPALASGQVYADLNTSGAPLKRELADIVAPSGAAFADVALMAPVPGRGVRTPALASGPGAAEFAALLRPLGMPVEVIGDRPGDAAARKLLRSVFMKGIAAAAVESLAAARAAGCEDWLRGELGRVLTDADAALLDRLETGSRRHAARRAGEVADAAALLRELGVEPRICDAAAGWLADLQHTD